MEHISGVVVGTDVTDDISTRILSMDVSLTTDMASQITMTVSDPGLGMLRGNYFQIRQEIDYLGQKWEIASIEVRQGRAGEEVVLECRLRAVQKLKRDKGSKTFSEGSATAFASARAREMGLSFFGEKSASKGRIARVRNDSTDESTWDVLVRLAGDNQYWCFESDGRLFFCSQQFLLGKFAITRTGTNPGFLTTRIDWTTNGKVLQEDSQPTTVQTLPAISGPSGRPTLTSGMHGEPYKAHIKYLQTVLKERAGQSAVAVDGSFGNLTLNAVKAVQKFFNVAEGGKVKTQTWAVIDYLASGVSTTGGAPQEFTVVPLGVPNLRRSDDAPEEASATFKLEREIGKQFRPGMTVNVDGVPGFAVNMLVTDVSWSEGTTDPVSVSCRTIEVPQSQKEKAAAQKRISFTGGGFANIDAGGFL